MAVLNDHILDRSLRIDRDTVEIPDPLAIRSGDLALAPHLHGSDRDAVVHEGDMRFECIRVKRMSCRQRYGLLNPEIPARRGGRGLRQAEVGVRLDRREGACFPSRAP
jgi:hypothetical protein